MNTSFAETHTSGLHRVGSLLVEALCESLGNAFLSVTLVAYAAARIWELNGAESAAACALALFAAAFLMRHVVQTRSGKNDENGDTRVFFLPQLPLKYQRHRYEHYGD